MPLEDLTPEEAEAMTPEEIRARIIKMDSKETRQKFYEKLSPETRARFQAYVMQWTGEFLSYMVESPES